MEKPFVFSESEYEDHNYLSPIPKKNLERNISGATDSSLSDIASPSKINKSFQKSFTIEVKAHNNYKTVVQKKVSWAVILFFVVILERVFVAPFQAQENHLIVSIQTYLGITYGHHNRFINFFLSMEEGLYFYLLLTHFFLVLYYYVNPVTCLKVMHVTLNALVCLLFLEIIMGEGRPFWESSEIVGVQCTDSYGFPNLSLFGVMFLFLYTRYCLKDHTDAFDDHTTSNAKKAFINVLYGLFTAVLCICQVLGGITYISQVVVVMIYVLFAYSLAVSFDKGITKLVEKSSIDIEAAKRHSIFWLIYLSIVGAISVFIYNGANPYMNITWLQNYVNCITNQNQIAYEANDTAGHLLGPWGSFIKIVVILMLLGAIFGAAKTFRDFKGVIWYAVDGRKKLKMALFANLCLIPSWVILCLRHSVFSGFGEINMFLFNGVHLFIMYFALFGVMPKHLFAKWNWVKSESDYHYIPDYLENSHDIAL